MNFEIPSGLTDLLQDFTVAVLRQRPADLYLFAADYFGEAYERRRRAAMEDEGDGDEDGESDDRKAVSFGIQLPASPPHENNVDGSHDSDEDEMIGW